MMIAAVYARKSTDQTGVADEQKSVARQVEHASAYARRKGWIVDNAHVYVDDGISGAEFAKRPGYMRLMASLSLAPPFQILVMSEESRLGREAIETAHALKQLVAAGVRVFSYLEDREVRLHSWTDKVLQSVRAGADEAERERAGQRTADAMKHKFLAGHVCGGRVFGYRNVDVVTGHDTDGRPIRSHVERQVLEDEAAVVRRIFDLCATGSGYSRIAKLLNDELAPAPRSQRGRPAGWSPSTVHDILHRDIYRGRVTYNRSQKRDQWGQKNQRRRSKDEWLFRDAPELAIVTPDTWSAAHDRIDSSRARIRAVADDAPDRDESTQPRRRGNESPYLLSGFARCGTCGGGIGVLSRSHGKQRMFFYGCTSHHKKGARACGNNLVLPIERVDEAVLSVIGTDILRPPVILAIIDGVLEALRPQQLGAAVAYLEQELVGVDRELANLAEAIASGGQLPPLLEALTIRQAHRDELVAAIAARQAVDVRRFDRKAIAAVVRQHVTTWRALLAERVEGGRQLLREILAGPLRFIPEGRSYRFEGEASIGQLLAGVAGLPTVLASPTGFEPVFWP